MRNLPLSIGSVLLSSCCSLDCAPFSTSELSTSPCLLQICKSDVKKKRIFRFSNFLTNAKLRMNIDIAKRQSWGTCYT